MAGTNPFGKYFVVGEQPMNLLQRYINAVRQYLPEALRDDVGRELKANIEDQSEAAAAV
ncbi:hypothetical protein GCM10011357_01420 [Lacimicrobium alkaliphilum]|uniref:Uncharacterized protein n=1 Tax=Lacimicrobium alkaliphilum TaxID=1526571 RepID=A0ABQ1QXR9_9ALTE|nr:hypothetical protein GCM10011357_01420 [Lacimicrobium alkaliphilum]